MNSIKTRDTLKRKLSKIYSKELEDQYKCFRNRLNHSIRFTKNEYYRNKLNLARGNIKQTWRIINDISENDPSVNILESTSFNRINGEKVTSNRENANLFSEHFKGVGVNLVESVKNCSLPSDFLKESSEVSSFYLKPVNVEEIAALISGLKNNCSLGPDGISSELLKNI